MLPRVAPSSAADAAPSPRERGEGAIRIASHRIYIRGYRSSRRSRRMRRMKQTAVVLLAAVLLAGCGPKESTPSAPASLQINGAGATFPNPIYSKWFDEYGKAHPNVHINYQSIGSGGGIKQLTAQTVFFGASDMPMTDEQLKGAPGPVLHFPTVLGGGVLVS